MSDEFDDIGFRNCRRNVILSSALLMVVMAYRSQIHTISVLGNSIEVDPWAILWVLILLVPTSLYRYRTVVNTIRPNSEDAVAGHARQDYLNRVLKADAEERLQPLYEGRPYEVVGNPMVFEQGEIVNDEYEIIIYTAQHRIRIPNFNERMAQLNETKTTDRFRFDLSITAMNYHIQKAIRSHRWSKRYFLDFNMPYIIAVICSTLSIVLGFTGGFQAHSR